MKKITKTELLDKSTNRREDVKLFDFVKEKQNRDRINAAKAISKRAQSLGW